MSVTFKKKSDPASAECQVFANLDSVFEAATVYSKQGFSPVPIKPKSKKPSVKWKSYSFYNDGSCSDFAPKNGVALRLGAKHGGLADLDLDTPEARRLACKFLPKTECQFGRDSAPESHFIFRTNEPLKSLKYQAIIDGNPVVLLELRGEGLLTVFPPSVHPSGENVRFENGKAGLPSAVELSNLRQRTDWLAAATLLAHVWPKSKGTRQDLALALAGGLISGGCQSQDAKLFIITVAEAAGDDEAGKRGEAVTSTVAKISAGEPVTGWPRLVEIFGGNGKEIVKRCHQWLGLTNDDNSLGITHTETGTLLVTTADQVKPTKIEWFWHGFVPRGEITILDGDPGTGKSTMCLDLAARQSAGMALPGGFQCEPRDVLVISMEDSTEATVVPRLIAAGADISRVHTLTEVKLPGGAVRPVSIPEDLILFEKLITKHGIGLVIIDPLVAFLGGKTDIYNDQSVRKALGPLKVMAEKTGAAIIAVRHLNKKEGISAMYKGGGSIGISGAARSVLIVGDDPDNPETRVLAVIKSNLCKAPKSWQYQIVDKVSPPDSNDEWEASSIEWLDTINLSAAHLVATANAQAPGALDDAMAFLQEVLAKADMLAKEVHKLAKDHGHSEKTLWRAAKKLEVKITPIHKNDKIAGWNWSLSKAVESSDQNSMKDGDHEIF